MYLKYYKLSGFLSLVVTSPLWADSVINRPPQKTTNLYQHHFRLPTHFTQALWRDLKLEKGKVLGYAEDPKLVQKLHQMKNDFALAIFTVDNCPSCASQKQILMKFREFFSWKIKEFNVYKHEKLVNIFNISHAPSILLIRRSPAQWMLISERKITLRDIKESVFNGIQQMQSGS